MGTWGWGGVWGSPPIRGGWGGPPPIQEYKAGGGLGGFPPLTGLLNLTNNQTNYNKDCCLFEKKYLCSFYIVIK